MLVEGLNCMNFMHCWFCPIRLIHLILKKKWDVCLAYPVTLVNGLNVILKAIGSDFCIN